MVGSAALGATAAIAKPARRSALAKGIEAAVGESFAKHGTPGAAVAVIRSGQTEYLRGFGTANLETGMPVSTRSIFRIGSITKQITAAAAIRLSASGKLDLSAPVSTYLPAFAKLPAFTALELIHQTAGLHSDESEQVPVQATAAKTQVELASEIANQAQPFDFEPGTAWLYSNANYITLGALIESISGLPFEQAMQALVFEPLGLASMAVDRPEQVVASRAAGYMVTGETAAPFVNAPYIDPTQAGGAGALRGNVEDVARWHHLLLSGRLFDQAHVRTMMEPGRLRDGRLSGDQRFLAEDAHYGDTQYAGGLLVSGPSEPMPNILHYGVISGFSAMLQTFTGTGVTVAVLCNAFIGPDVPFRGVRKAVKEHYQS